MRVRGIPSLEGTGSLGHTHYHHHHRMTRDDSAVNIKSNHFEDPLTTTPFQHHTTNCSSAAPASTSANTAVQTPPAWEQRLSCLLSRVAVTMEKNEARLSDKDKKDTIKLEWQQAALILDR